MQYEANMSLDMEQESAPSKMGSLHFSIKFDGSMAYVVDYTFNISHQIITHNIRIVPGMRKFPQQNMVSTGCL